MAEVSKDAKEHALLDLLFGFQGVIPNEEIFKRMDGLYGLSSDDWNDLYLEIKSRPPK